MNKVVEMLDKHLKWREEFQPSAEEFYPQTIKDDYPAGYTGTTDYDENLIYCERPSNAGKCHPSEFVRKYTLPVIARWHASGMEMGIQRMRNSDYAHKRVCYVVDLLNVKALTRPMIGFAQTLASVEQDNYPENLGRVFIVNCPTFFRWAWKLIKIFVDARTNKKIHFMAPGSAVKGMKEVMPEEEIPNFCGGTSNKWMETNGGILGSTDPSKAYKGELKNTGAEEFEKDIESGEGEFETIPEGDFPSDSVEDPSPGTSTVGSPNTTASPNGPSEGK
ncbi:sec14, cytosolic factor [Angomonas deanei]|uniref:CRAL/TRIO domain/Divergent CRAL/TRIO domain containing protein, putative n=1 Tax=Angomonas deanei TaxID=59799 RepID=A0A7G2C386_9TRYP|nr:sec14, cytosolic factor [Angomonas deanei]CAD2214140.1 CRAL/TRIO domain/Divergent CRAL/TRIO domain containing protein, putative [Angomonas deanei]|eukprot:EPY24537.1 sec14, cytosolic factor [Angomonas deanei]